MMEYIKARLDESAMADSFRIYITDAVYHLAHRHSFEPRWAELIKPKEPERSPEEVLVEVISKTGLVI